MVTRRCGRSGPLRRREYRFRGCVLHRAMSAHGRGQYCTRQDKYGWYCYVYPQYPRRCRLFMLEACKKRSRPAISPGAGLLCGPQAGSPKVGKPKSGKETRPWGRRRGSRCGTVRDSLALRLARLRCASTLPPQHFQSLEPLRPNACAAQARRVSGGTPDPRIVSRQRRDGQDRPKHAGRLRCVEPPVRGRKVVAAPSVMHVSGSRAEPVRGV